MQNPNEPNRLCREGVAHVPGPGRSRKALGIEEVQDAQDSPESRRQLRELGCLERNAEGTNPLFRAHDALLHRRHRHEQRVGHFGGREPGDKAQRQRNAIREIERRVGAHKEQLEPVVGQLRDLGVADALGRVPQRRRHGCHIGFNTEVREFLRETRLAPDDVDCFALRGRLEPGLRRIRDAGARPCDECLRVGLLRDVFGEIEIAKAPG